MGIMDAVTKLMELKVPMSIMRYAEYGWLRVNEPRKGPKEMVE